ncbi:TPA: hypothetical protein ACH3X1_013349 [Trebouxia sp. C0004]
MDATAPSGDAESADLVDLSKEDSSDKGKKRSSTTEFEPSAVKRVKLSYHDPDFHFLVVFDSHILDLQSQAMRLCIDYGGGTLLSLR